MRHEQPPQGRDYAYRVGKTKGEATLGEVGLERRRLRCREYLCDHPEDLAKFEWLPKRPLGA